MSKDRADIFVDLFRNERSCVTFRSTVPFLDTVFLLGEGDRSLVSPNLNCLPGSRGSGALVYWGCRESFRLPAGL